MPCESRVALHDCNTSTQKQRARGQKFKVILSHVVIFETSLGCRRPVPLNEINEYISSHHKDTDILN